MSSSEEKSLNFIYHIIENDLSEGRIEKSSLRFRFPPEPNGYLHIGHAKAICLNFGLGDYYQAPVNLRFDDTNPENEKIHFIEAIKKDIQWLGYKWDKECYTSDYFEQLYLWAVQLIKEKKAYIDSQKSEQIALQKGTPTKAGEESPYRNRPIDESLMIFEQMKNGEIEEGIHVLRAKIDMTSSNMLMRDPIIYRVIKASHHRTGNKWNIYPMYDWAHGQSDYVERISHSFCSMEFAMHRQLYQWFLNQLEDNANKQPHQYEFARLNLNYTIMSKRKLAQLVSQKIVDGWDDPRMPTLSGLRRRGYTPESIRKFCEKVGIAKRDNLIDVSLLEFCVREDLNKIAPRVMGVFNPVKLIITNYPKEKEEWLDAENNPEEEILTYRKVPFSRELYIEKEDFREEANRKFFRLKLGGEVRLKNGYIIKAESVKKDIDGNVLEIYATYDPLSKSGSGTPESLRKVKGTLHWVSIKHAICSQVNIYDRLFNDPDPDKCEGGFMKCLNPNSLQKTNAFVEPSLRNTQKGTQYQFQRLGYFVVEDVSATVGKLVFNKIVGLKDSWNKLKLNS